MQSSEYDIKRFRLCRYSLDAPFLLQCRLIGRNGSSISDSTPAQPNLRQLRSHTINPDCDHFQVSLKLHSLQTEGGRRCCLSLI